MYVHFHNVRPLNATTASSMAGYQEMHCLDKAPECSLLAGFLEAITHHEYVDIYRKSNGSCALVYGLGVLMTWDSWRPLFCTLSLSLSLFISRMEHNGTVYQGELLPTSQCEGNAEKLKQRADSHYSVRSLLPSKSALHLNLTSTRLRFSKLSLCC